jgi:tetraacyldisaccharide 4'-kinase
MPASYLERVIATEDAAAGSVARVLRAGLSGLASLYDAGLTAYLAAERAGLRRRERLPVPVISVGNLSVGGTGKTPFTIFLAGRLKAQGLRIAILSRGHGGESQSIRVVSDGVREALNPEQAGDEPVLLARSCPGVPVLVGKDRRQSGREALRRWPLDLLLLDDGFQYWQLARDLDIVLLDSRSPFENGYPLPRGLLREPPRNLARAGLVVATRADRIDAAARESLRSRVADLAPDARLFFAEHTPLDLIPIGAPAPTPSALEHLRGLPVAAVSAIARPESFVALLRACEADIVLERHKPDHGDFAHDEAVAVVRDAAAAGAQAVVLTEKDAVKWPAGVDGLSVLALRIGMTVEDEPTLLRHILMRILKTRAGGDN